MSVILDEYNSALDKSNSPLNTEGKIFIIMAKSSTGKDSLYKRILEHFYDYKIRLYENVQYTTRPIRENEIDGINYYFTTVEDMENRIRLKKVVEKRKYNTKHGVWHYFMCNDNIDLTTRNYLLISTLEGYESIRTYYGDDKVIPIYIEVEDGTRLERALKREREQVTPKYSEMCRRFLADEEDFSSDNLSRLGIMYSFINDNFSDCLADIISYIQKQLK